MTSSPQEEIKNAAQAISDMHAATVPGEHAQAAGHAAANLCPGAGHQLLYLSPELHQLIDEAIEIGYATALQDVRSGKFDGDIRDWLPDLFSSQDGADR
ncbi:hypothetical protein GCM10010329_22580 [Streptomyces spiroverticillatus]|uniref:Uncharacterized protein n=1 Tax=Streptomyces finlayi TaxID=67296 RepID=A0A918WUG9_9ACTN|nr:hypothetical protein [Streptomyces finlayi]GHA00295.1 hypothetical protein GCM10010329_22580 [Streptomyces spiroverticillatus]GHC84770.1 hypothetical protein GCM10010334_15010 [Streptomyces finlayi]